MREGSVRSQAAGAPPRRRPPGGVAAGELPPEPGLPRRPRDPRDGSLGGWLRWCEQQIFGPVRTVGPRPGRTPTF